MSRRNIRETHNKHLRDPEIAAEYINQALLSDELAVILMAIRNVVDAYEGGISCIAEKSALGRESMYKMLSSRGNPKLSTLKTLFHALGLRLEVIPEERDPEPVLKRPKRNSDETRTTR